MTLIYYTRSGGFVNLFLLAGLYVLQVEFLRYLQPALTTLEPLVTDNLAFLCYSSAHYVLLFAPTLHQVG